jgi:hypothetical protein
MRAPLRWTAVISLVGLLSGPGGCGEDETRQDGVDAGKGGDSALEGDTTSEGGNGASDASDGSGGTSTSEAGDGSPEADASTEDGEADADSPDDAPAEDGAGGGEAGDASGDGNGAFDGTADAVSDADGGGGCEARRKLLEFAFANKGCASISDCTVATTCSIEYEACNSPQGGFYLNKTYDSAKWKQLDSSLSACGSAYCMVSGCAWLSPATCWHSTCWRDQGPSIQASRDQCYAAFNRNTICATCYCAYHSGLCETDADCLKLLQCAHDNACLGGKACLPSEPTSPCKAIVDALGGPNAGSVVKFSNVLASLGTCDVACSKP